LCDRDAIAHVLESGQLAGVGAHSYSKGNATSGSELEVVPNSLKALLAHCRYEIKPRHFMQSETKIRRPPAINYRVVNNLMRHLLDQLTLDINAAEEIQISA